MQNPRLAARYAKSILDLAVERNSLDDTLKDMDLLDSICTQSRDFVVMLRSPIISGDKKMSAIREVVKSYNVGVLTNTFVQLLITKGREENLPEIAAAFVSQYNTLKNIKLVKLTTAVPVDDAVKENIKARLLADMPGDSIQMKTEVDATLIGGFVLEMEDRLYDASIKKSLNDIRSKIIDNSYVSKI